MTIQLVQSVLDDLAQTVRWHPEHGLSDGGAWSGAGEAAVQWLRDHVYARYFCRWAPPPGLALVDDPGGSPHFVAQLEAATQGHDCWEAGWTIVKSRDDWAYVSNGHVNLFVEDRTYLEPQSASLGQEVQVRMPCSRPNLAPGFFYFVGRAGLLESGVPHAKIYLNLDSDAAPQLLQSLLSAPEAERLIFEGKVANDPRAYGRVDTAMLYVMPASIDGLTALVRRLAEESPGWLREGTPLFTKAVARGVAIAQSPYPRDSEARESFGQHRCGLLARAVVRSLEAGDDSPRWLARLEAELRAQNISLETPWAHSLAL